MTNTITKSLNIVTILTKQRSKNINFCRENYIFGLHMQEAIFKVNTVKEVYGDYENDKKKKINNKGYKACKKTLLKVVV